MSAEPRRTTETEDWAAWENQAVNGVFPLRRLLGCSEHSAVFLTEYKPRKLPDAAIKFIRADDAVAGKEQLTLWQAAASLSHPHLIRLFAMGRYQAGPHEYVFIVMEHAEQTLAQILNRRALDPEEARELLFPSLDVLTFLHRGQLAHGRLQPSNFLAVGDQLKLASDTIRPAGHAGGGIIRPVSYDPPDRGSSTAGDMWSLGMTLVEALTQRAPTWSGQKFVAVPEGLPSPFADTVRRCLSLSPADRPTATKLAAQYKSAAQAESVSDPQSPEQKASQEASPLPAHTMAQVATSPLAYTVSQAVASASTHETSQVHERSQVVAAPPAHATSQVATPSPAQTASNEVAPPSAHAAPQAAIPPSAHAASQIATSPSALVASQAATPPSTLVASQATTPPQALKASQVAAPAPAYESSQVASTPPTHTRSLETATLPPAHAASLVINPPSAHTASREVTSPAVQAASQAATPPPTHAASLAITPSSAHTASREVTPPAVQAASKEVTPPTRVADWRAPISLPTQRVPKEITPPPPAIAAWQAAIQPPAQKAPKEVIPPLPQKASQVASPPQAHAALQETATPFPAQRVSNGTIAPPAPKDSRVATPPPAYEASQVASPAPAQMVPKITPPPIHEAPRGAAAPPTQKASQEFIPPPSLPKEKRLSLPLIAAALLIPVAVWIGLRSMDDAQEHFESSVVPPPPTIAPPVIAKPAAPSATVANPVALPPEQPSLPPASDSPSVLHEVMPDVPQSISDKIQGRIYVTVRVLVDPSGNVYAALLDSPGPSKYFARLADNAAREWQFVPAEDEGDRVWLLRFQFTRDGVDVRATAQ